MFSMAIHLLIHVVVLVTTSFPFMFVNLVNALFFKIDFFPSFFVLGMKIFRINVAAAVTIATTAITTTATTAAAAAITTIITMLLIVFYFFQSSFFFFTFFPF